MSSRPVGERRQLMAILLVAAALVMVGACGSDNGTGASASSSSGPAATVAGESGGSTYPDIVDAVIEPADEGAYDLDVTVSSPYDSPERYADGWRVLGPDGNELGTHQLTHDHAGEQPFTRTQTGLEIPDDVKQVTIEGHDLDNGYGGQTLTVAVPEG